MKKLFIIAVVFMSFSFINCETGSGEYDVKLVIIQPPATQVYTVGQSVSTANLLVGLQIEQNVLQIASSEYTLKWEDGTVFSGTIPATAEFGIHKIIVADRDEKNPSTSFNIVVTGAADTDGELVITNSALYFEGYSFITTGISITLNYKGTTYPITATPTFSSEGVAVAPGSTAITADAGVKTITATVVGREKDFTINVLDPYNPGPGLRTIKIDMYDSNGTYWNSSANGASIRININNRDRAPNAAILTSANNFPSGQSNTNTFLFLARPDDVVRLFWNTRAINWGQFYSFIVYYYDTPPHPEFSPGSNLGPTSWTGENALEFRIRSATAAQGGVWNLLNGSLLCEFTVEN